MLCSECTNYIPEEYRKKKRKEHKDYCNIGNVKETCDLLAATFGTPASKAEREIMTQEIKGPKDANEIARDGIHAIMDEFVETSNDPKKGKFNSTHEGLGVIREEYKEFEDEVFANNSEDACKEAVQLAASALRFIVDFKKPFETTLSSCLSCKFVQECLGPRENGCRRFPE